MKLFHPFAGALLTEGARFLCVTGHGFIMSTPPHVTILPPQEYGYGHGGTKPKFDRHAFAGRRSKVVSARTRIAFQDLSGMHIQKRVPQRARRLGTPEWSLTDEGIRKAVLAYLERRVYQRTPDPTKTDAERLEIVNKKLKDQLPEKEGDLDNLLLRLHNARINSGNDGYIRRLQIEVQNVDSQIVLLRRGLAAVIVSALVLYYRLGYSSVEVAEELNILPPMVRIWSFRINHIATGRQIPFTNNNRTCGKNWLPSDLRRLFAMRVSGKTWEECAAALKVVSATVRLAWKNCFQGLVAGRQLAKPKPPREKQPREKQPRKNGLTHDYLRRLFSLRTSGHSFTECAKALGKTPSGVRATWIRYFGSLKSTVVHKNHPHKNRKRAWHNKTKWTSDEILKLKKLREEEKKTIAQCAQLLGRSRASILYGYARAGRCQLLRQATFKAL
jgi:hypothetical protein